MTEQIKEILNKIPAMLLLAAILGYFGYGHYEFVTDPSSPLLQKREQVNDAAQKQKAELQGKLKSAQEFFSETSRKKDESNSELSRKSWRRLKGLPE